MPSSVDGSRAGASSGASGTNPAAAAAACFGANDLRGAEAWIRVALQRSPSSSEYRIRLAATLHRQNRVDEAVAEYREGARLDPSSFDAHMGLGSCELDRRNAASAEAWFRRALALDPARAVAWAFLGAALDRQQRTREARAAHEKAMQLETAKGEAVGAYLGVAGNLRDDARFAEALAVLQSNLQSGQSAEANTLYAHMLLTLGQLREGFWHNEFRLLTDHFLARRPPFTAPMWNGQVLRGRTILLRAEQGMGDTIQFARYASHVKAHGATVFMAVPRELVEIAKRLHGVDRVCVLPDDETRIAFDYWIPMLSLPRAFGTELATIPANVPYIDVDPVRAARWSARFAADGDGLKVGLAFGGNPQNFEDPYRSLPLEVLAPLAAVPGVRLYSLQKGTREADAAAPPAGFDLVNLGPEIVDFVDTAAAIVHLDLVISVCTSVAHLTGALGKPLWMMLHRAADWRWLTDRDDSPWYPTARLFRQRVRGDWTDVVDRVRVAMHEFATTSQRSERKRPGARLLEPPDMHEPYDAPGYRPGFSAVAQTRVGLVEYFPDDGACGASIAWYGEWQQHTQEAVAKWIRPSATVLEVGAGVGMRALALADIVGSGGRVITLETRAKYRRVLRQNLAVNCATIARVSEAETADAMAPERVDWLAISEIGSPSQAIGGAAETLWRLRPAVLVFDVRDDATSELVRQLHGYGYRCWRFEASLFNARNFNRRPEDIFHRHRSLVLVAFPEESDRLPMLDDCVELA